MEYDNTNRFAIFPVKEKKNPKGPDYDGPGDCNGRPIRVACWVKVSSKGQKFLSCKIEFKDEQQAEHQSRQQSQPAARPTQQRHPVAPTLGDGDIPF